MWSLPNIKALNDRAAANRRQIQRESKLKTSRKHPCEYCTRPSTRHLKWWDIFSDDPKGVTHLCEDHYEQGASDDGFFDCARCHRRVADHYTWEQYGVVLGGELVCLRCAAEEYFADVANWIEPKLVKAVVLVPHNPRLNGENLPLFDPTTGVLNVARCRHVLGVSQPLPAGIKFLDNAEFDSMDGHQISGRKLLDIIQELDEPFCPVLDAAYQFAVSIGLYVRRWPADKPFKGHWFTKAGDRRVLPITFSKRYHLPRWAGIALDSGWEAGKLQIEGNPLLPVTPEREAA